MKKVIIILALVFAVVTFWGLCFEAGYKGYPKSPSFWFGLKALYAGEKEEAKLELRALQAEATNIQLRAAQEMVPIQVRYQEILKSHPDLAPPAPAPAAPVTPDPKAGKK